MQIVWYAIAFLLLAALHSNGQSTNINWAGNLTGSDINGFRGGIWAKKYARVPGDTAHYGTLPDSLRIAIVGGKFYYNNGTQWLTPTQGGQINADWNAVGGVAQILHKPTLVTSYHQLTDTPTTFHGSYHDLIDTPVLNDIAYSGLYSDLIGAPTLFSGAYADLTGKPTLFSGDYNDLTNKPTLTTAFSSLTDVNLTSLANGQLTKYNSGTSKWENFTPTYISSYTETDPVYVASVAHNITATDTGHYSLGWLKYITGGLYSSGTATFTRYDGTTFTVTGFPTNNNQLTNGAGYLTSYTETDPVYIASVAHNLTATDTGHYSTAWLKYILSGSYSSGTATFTRYDGTTFNVTGFNTNSGTVTSVGLSLPGIFSVTPTPITSAGTFSVTAVTQTANYFWAGPTSGGAAQPTFRAMVAADVPTLNQNTTGSSASCTGNAATATALATGRTINGTTFDGTGNITVTAAAGTLTGTTLNSTVVTSSLTSLGAVTTGTWTATAIGNSYLANSSLTVNGTSISLGGSGTVTAAAGTLTGTTLNSTVVTSSLTSHGTITSGGLGTGAVIAGVTMTLGSDASYDVYYRNSSGIFTRLAAGADGYVLTTHSVTSAPTWTAVSSSGGTVTSVGVSVPTDFAVASSPVTTSGTIAITHAGLNTISDGANFVFNGNNGNFQTITIAAARTFTISNLVVGVIYKFIVKQDGTGGRVLTWGTTVKAAWNYGGTPPISAGANAIDVYELFTDGTNIYAKVDLNHN